MIVQRPVGPGRDAHWRTQRALLVRRRGSPNPLGGGEYLANVAAGINRVHGTHPHTKVSQQTETHSFHPESRKLGTVKLAGYPPRARTVNTVTL